MPTYTVQPACVRKLTYKLVNNTPGFAVGELPSFVTFDSKTNDVTLTGLKRTEMDKKYSFTFVAESVVDKVTNMEHTFEIDVPRNLPFYFKTKLEIVTLTSGVE